MSCSHQCEQNNCPFVSDPQRPSRYICLKCGLERDIDEGRNTFGMPFIFLAVLALVVLFYSRSNLEIKNPIIPRRATTGNSIDLPPYSFDRHDRVN